MDKLFNEYSACLRLLFPDISNRLNLITVVDSILIVTIEVLDTLNGVELKRIVDPFTGDWIIEVNSNLVHKDVFYKRFNYNDDKNLEHNEIYNRVINEWNNKRQYFPVVMIAKDELVFTTFDILYNHPDVSVVKIID